MVTISSALQFPRAIWISSFATNSKFDHRFTSIISRYLTTPITQQNVLSHKINDDIISSSVRLIIPGENVWDEVMIGIVPLEEALSKAKAFGMDLVEINEKSDPPVCRIIDYGKFKFKLLNKKKANKVKQTSISLKEVKMTCMIDNHDFEVRMKAIKKFLDDGDRVRNAYVEN